MMHTTKSLEKSQKELTITVTPAEYANDLALAATRLSNRAAIHGFRPGHAPFDVIKKQFGEMAILQEALESIIQHSFYQAVTEEKLDTIGMPKVEVEKLAPGNDVVYRATVALLPTISLGDISKVTVKKQENPVEEKHVEETLTALRGMRAAEVIRNDAARPEDKVVIDMNMFLDKIPVEGGQTKGYQVYLSEESYIPGFNKELLGLKKGDEKEFSLMFPESHYQKMLAGKTVDFKIKVTDVYERTLPPADDAFAEKLGQPSFAELKALVRKNMEQEARHKGMEKAEIEILEKVVYSSKISDIPDVLIDAEKQKMFHELTRDLERHNVTIDQYLQDIKKKEDELFRDFQIQAEKRVKAALVSREIAKEQNLGASKEDVDKEITMMREMYKDNKEYLANVEKPGIRDTIASMIQNRKVMSWLKVKILGEDLVQDVHIHGDACGGDHDHYKV